MTRYKNILVAFDGSKDGLKALDAAKTMTADNDAHLTVIYVHDEPLEYPVNIGTAPSGEQFMFAGYASGAIPGDVPDTPDDEQLTIVEEEMPKRVMETAQSKFDDGFAVAYEKLVGKPAAEIVDYANDNDIDLIIIGNRGIGAFQKLFQGSVSKKVLDNAECAVFVVK